MGQYPTGRLFRYNGKTITELKGWPPKLEGVSGSAREAQTTVVYGGSVLVGVWPWGELWRYDPDSKTWTSMRRMFDHPGVTHKIVHPYDVENRGGQRVTSLVHLSATTRWTDGPTKIEFTLRGGKMTITQDGKQLATSTLSGPLAKRVSTLSGLKNVKWGDGIHGRFRGKAIDGVGTGW